MIHQAAAALLIGVMAGALTGQLVHERARVGGAAHYGPGTMERVARNRGLRPTSCDVAVTDHHRIGAWVTITRPKTGHVERCRITDVCNVALGHCAALRRRGIVAELSWDAAKRLCRISRPRQEPPGACVVEVRW